MSGDFGDAHGADPPAIREATAADLPRLLELYVALGGDFEDALKSDGIAPEYADAFAAVNADSRQRLLVIEAAGCIVGTLVLLIVPNISRRGRPYALVENVVVDEAERRRGHGAALMRYAIEEARKAGCYKVALTSRLHRTEAHAFYERLSFTAESKGFRLAL